MEKITGIYLFTEVGRLADTIAFNPRVHVGRGMINGNEVAMLAGPVAKIGTSPYNPNHIIVHGLEGTAELPISLTSSNYLAVFDQSGRLIAYGDYCCTNCFQNSGQHIGRTLTVACEKCHQTWELPRTVNL